MKKETLEYSLLQHIKTCLQCNNESQAIRLLEKYGFEMQEQDKNMYSDSDMTNYALYILHNDVITPKEWLEKFKNK